MFKYLFYFLLFSTYSYSNDNLEQCDKLIYSGVDELYNKNYSKSIELLNKAKVLAYKNNWAKQLFLSKNNIGLNYYYLYQYDDAIENYLEAYQIALNKLDSNFEMIVLNNIGMLYLREKKNYEAEKYFTKAYNLAIKNKNKYKIGLYASNIAWANSGLKKINKVEKFLRIAEPFVKNDNNLNFQIQVIKAETFFNKKEYDNSQKILEELLPKLNKNEYNEYKIISLLLISKIYEFKYHNIPKSIEYAKIALNQDLDLLSKVETNDILYDLFLKNNQIDKALFHKELSYSIKDSLNKIKSEILFDNVKTKLKIQSYQKDLNDNNKKLIKERRINIFLLFLLLVIIVVTIWAVKSNITKYKQRKIISELEINKINNEKQILENELKEKEVLALLEKEYLKNEVESKNRKIAVKALQLANRNEIIEEIINSIASQPEIDNNNIIKNNINKLKSQLKSKNEWNDFLKHFEDVNQTFLLSLRQRHPDLTSNDIRFILYIYMNLTTKEIASLFNITIEACRKRKERIAKKINLSESDSIYSYLSAI